MGAGPTYPGAGTPTLIPTPNPTPAKADPAISVIPSNAVKNVFFIFLSSFFPSAFFLLRPPKKQLPCQR
jgi:hypothetical protein